MPRVLVATLVAMIISIVVGPKFIAFLRRNEFGQQIREEGPEHHSTKQGTPTMGGMLMIVVVMFLAMAMRIEDVSTLTPMLTLVGVGILGAIDDYVNAQTGIGMRGRYKLIWQTLVALLAAWYIQRHFLINEINVPLVGDVGILPILFILFVAFVIVAMSNGVNLTDGLDGLAIVPVMIAATAGTTVAGMIDPLEHCAAIARAEDLWYHVDAAWGGAAIASDRLRGVLAGLELAESVTIDAHKWFATTMGCAMFLMREGGRGGHTPLSAEFHASPTYMPPSNARLDPYPKSVHWSPPFLRLGPLPSPRAPRWSGDRRPLGRRVKRRA